MSIFPLDSLGFFSPILADVFLDEVRRYSHSHLSFLRLFLSSSKSLETFSLSFQKHYPDRLSCWVDGASSLSLPSLYLIALKENRALVMEADEIAQKATVRLKEKNYNPNQLWVMHPDGLILSSVNQDLAMDITGGVKKNACLQLYRRHNGPNQIYRIRAPGFLEVGPFVLSPRNLSGGSEIRSTEKENGRQWCLERPPNMRSDLTPELEEEEEKNIFLS